MRIDPQIVHDSRDGASDVETFFGDEAQELCYQLAEEVVAEIRHIIDTRYPPASLPDMPPAYRTGALWWGYRAAKVVVNGERGAQVWTDVDYATYLEYGTSKMAARPHVAPSVEIVRRRHQ